MLSVLLQPGWALFKPFKSSVFSYSIIFITYNFKFEWNILLFFIVMYYWKCQYPVDLSTLPDTQKFFSGWWFEVTEDFASVNVIWSLERLASTGAYTIP